MARAPAYRKGHLPGVSPADIWKELIRQGASSTEAAGIMGNMIMESSLNVESAAMDSNGAMAYGLVSWNAASYPHASTLVTGNPQQDLTSQVTFLAQTGGFRAARGATASQAGGNFAANYERCQGCQPGGVPWKERAANAVKMLAASKSGKWPQNDSGKTPTGTTSADPAQCLIGFSNNIPVIPFVYTQTISVCFVSKSEGRALLGFGLFAGGMLIALPGLSLIATAAAVKYAGPLLAMAYKVPIAGSYARAGVASVSARATAGP